MEAFLDILEIIGCVLFVVFFLGFCVFIHELGHFLTAKMCGLHVNAFSLGFKKAWGRKIGGVDYRIGWLPFGGYVDIPQIDSTEIPHTDEGKELPPSKPIHRLLSAFAGPLFNILFGLALGCVVWYIGVPQDSPKMREITVASIEKVGPEYKAGLRKNDKIFKLNDKTFFCTWKEFVFKTILTIGEVKLDVNRDGENMEIAYIPQQNPNAPERMKFEKMPWPYFQAKIPIKMFPKKDSPAAKGGMKDGDVIVSINDKRIKNYDEFFGMINYSNGKTLNITVSRDGENIKLAPIKPVLHEKAMKMIKDVYLIGVFFIPDTLPLTVFMTVPNAPAMLAGIKSGDIIEKLNGKKVTNYKIFQTEIKPLKGIPFTLQLKRGDKILDVKLAAVQRRIYEIGVSLMILDHPTPWRQFVNVIDMSYKSLRGLGVFFMNKAGVSKTKSSIKPSNLSGPIGLAKTLYRSVRVGTIRFGLYFVVLVSFALAIFNLLPLPVLDGGHMTLALIEIVIRRPLHDGVVKFLTFIFIFLLISLMIYVSYFDILRSMPKDWQKAFDPRQASKKIEKVTPAKVIIEKKDVKETPVKTDKSR
ncbi:MAG: site-2 protease family protein [Victivallales bacterium]|nr:site-2 protease family protein [Victivallales bacterium]